MKKLLCISLVFCLCHLSCSRFFVKSDEIQHIELNLNAIFSDALSLNTIDGSRSFKRTFQVEDNSLFFLDLESMSPIKEEGIHGDQPVLFKQFRLEEKTIDYHLYDVEAIKYAYTPFQSDTYDTPQQQYPIAILEDYFLHFMVTRNNSAEIWMSSKSLDEFHMIDTASILTNVAYQGVMETMFGVKNQFAFHKGWLAYVKNNDIVIINLEDVVQNTYKEPIILLGKAQQLYRPYSYPEKSSISLVTSSDHLILKIITNNQKSSYYFFDKNNREMITDVLISGTDFLQTSQYFSVGGESIFFTNDIASRKLGLLDLKRNEQHVIDIELLEIPEIDMAFIGVLASYNETGWLFHLFPYVFMEGTSNAFYQLQLNQNMQAIKLFKLHWQENSGYRHLKFISKATSDIVMMFAQNKTNEDYVLISYDPENILQDGMLAIAPLQLPFDAEGLTISLSSIKEYMIVQASHDDEELIKSVSFWLLEKK